MRVGTRTWHLDSPSSLCGRFFHRLVSDTERIGGLLPGPVWLPTRAHLGDDDFLTPPPLHLANSPADGCQALPPISLSVTEDVLTERGAWSWQPHNLIRLRLGQISALCHPPSPGANAWPNPLPNGAVRPPWWSLSCSDMARPCLDDPQHPSKHPGSGQTGLSPASQRPTAVGALTTLGAVFRAPEGGPFLLSLEA